MIKRLTENFQDDERYEYIKSKTVLDSDGWRTDYTMYYDWEDGKYIFIFGDNDLYDPTNESPDWECDTEAQANDWFDNYTGFDDEEDFDECYLSETNNNTEEQELAEFLDWLKQEKIRVTDVNKKFKMIHIQNPDDLDMASWYLHDRDYFKKLSDFGWMVSAPSPAGRKVAKALKMESMEFDGFTYSDADIVEALAYMYGISYEEVHKALKNNEFTDNEIKRAITYWNLDGYNPKEKQAEYNRRCKELGICENTEHTYRVWYRPYGLDGDEEDYIDVIASNEGEAIRFARTCGNTTDVELLESKQLNEDEVQEFSNEVTVQINKYSDRSGTYVKSRIIPNVIRIEDTDNYFYICTSDDYCYEYAKDSLYDGSYRYTILD